MSNNKNQQQEKIGIRNKRSSYKNKIKTNKRKKKKEFINVSALNLRSISISNLFKDMINLLILFSFALLLIHIPVFHFN